MAPKCYLWPDKKPVKDLSGLRVRKLLCLLPVYKKEVWYYLWQCDCGRETIVKVNSKTGSCGCLRRAPRKQKPRPPQHLLKLGFDRSICQHKFGNYCFTCKHYNECQDERIFDKKPVSSRFIEGGTCYVPSAVEASFYEQSNE